MAGRETIGTFEPEMLIASDKYPIDVAHVTVVSGQGVLKRGTILAVNVAGKVAILGTESCTAAFILAADIDATSTDVVAPAYRSGNFVRNSLIIKAGYTMTVADETNLRNAGIYLDNAML